MGNVGTSYEYAVREFMEGWEFTADWLSRPTAARDLSLVAETEFSSRKSQRSFVNKVLSISTENPAEVAKAGRYARGQGDIADYCEVVLQRLSAGGVIKA